MRRIILWLPSKHANLQAGVIGQDRACSIMSTFGSIAVVYGQGVKDTLLSISILVSLLVPHHAGMLGFAMVIGFETVLSVR